MLRRLLAILVPVLALTFVACGSDSGTPGDDGTPKVETDGKETAKSDQWNYINNPSRFQIQYEYNYDVLAAQEYVAGEAEQLPWPSDYWSYYQDSTNVRYHAGQLSPVEKYDVAFHGWTPNMELQPLGYADCDSSTGTLSNRREDYYAHLGPAASWQSTNKGNGVMRDGIDNDNDGKTDECQGDDYDGIETWWGLCHAWAPAAILEPEPLHPVTYQGVEFSVSDIKALLITMYDRSSASMLGDRCNVKEVKRDEHGRVTEDECRDTNAGAWHVVAVNMLGMQKRAFAMDRTFDYQVWNQPVLGYQIREQRKISEEEAVTTLGHPAGTKYTAVFNSPEAVGWVYVDMDMRYITESDNEVEDALTTDRNKYNRYVRTDRYKYVLELNKDGDIVGGEWLAYSQDTHPDFLWLPLRGYGGNPSMTLGNVRMLLELSRKTDEPPPTDLTIKSYGDTLTSALAIPDNDATGVSRTLTVPDDITIGSLKVEVEIKHTYIGDLLVTLTRNGKTVTLHDRTGGSQSDIVRTFTVTDFNGQAAGGDWELAISDHAGQDVGTLVKWGLTVGTADTSSGQGRVVKVDGGLSSPLAIPDKDDNGVSAELTVADEGTIESLEVKVDITHTYIGDLKVVLVHNGSEQILHSREGGSNDNIAKTYTVEGFDGAPVKGTWTLLLTDHAGQDVGTLNSWSLNATVN